MLKNNIEQLNSNRKRAKIEEINIEKFIITIVIFIISIALFTSFLRIPYFNNTVETYNLIFYVNLASILIFSAGIMFRPWVALFICVLGSVLGELIFCLIFGCGESLPAYLIFMVVSPGFAGALISILKQKIKKEIYGEIIAMIIGGIWLYLGLMISAFIYYEVFISGLSWKLYAVYIWFPFFSTVYDLLLIPISLALNKALRKILKIRYFDELLLKPLK
jgi:hypothetical protein